MAKKKKKEVPEGWWLEYEIGTSVEIFDHFLRPGEWVKGKVVQYGRRKPFAPVSVRVKLPFQDPMFGHHIYFHAESLATIRKVQNGNCISLHAKQMEP